MRSLTHCQAWIERIMHVQHAEVKWLVCINTKQDRNVNRNKHWSCSDLQRVLL